MNRIIVLPKLWNFITVVTGLIAAKLWHDTLPIFLDLYSFDGISRLLLSRYASANSIGMTLGGIFAGLFTDSLSPRFVFPRSMAGVFVSSFLLMLSFEFKSFTPWLSMGMAFFVYLMVSSFIYEKTIYFIVKTSFTNPQKAILVAFFYSLQFLLIAPIWSFLLFFITSAIFLMLSIHFWGTDSLYKKDRPTEPLHRNISVLLFLSIYLTIFAYAFMYFSNYSFITQFQNNFEVGNLSSYSILSPPRLACMIDPKLILLFIRGSLISTSMNAAYVAVGDLYKGSSWLPVASAYLYTALFGSLASVPIIIKYTSKNLFIFLCIINFILTFSLKYVIKERDVMEIKFRNYIRSLWILLKSPEFRLVCSVSMICIGSFYNLMYTFKDAYINKDFTGDVVTTQSIGRYSTFFIGVLASFSGLKFFRISNKNCAQLMYSGMGLVSIAMFCLSFLFITKRISFASQVIFYLICACSGICQPAAKASILSIGQSLGNIPGAAQSLNTFFYSFIESVGLNIIFRFTYPVGCIAYLLLAASLVMMISIFIYLRRNKINSYISSEP